MTFQKAMVDALKTHLAANVAGVQAVYPEWPNKNQSLALPSISILSQDVPFKRCSPYLLSIGTVASHQATNKYIVGQHEATLQLDIWAKNKPERATMFERVFAVLNPPAPAGFRLQLTTYHNQWVSFTLVDHRYMDSEVSATSQEWRAVLTLEASCRAIASQSEYIITQEPELVFTTPDNIPIP